jgi:hypothetical protein
LPSEATLTVRGSGNDPVGTVAGRSINDSLKANRRSGVDTESPNRYWLPLVQGDTATLSMSIPKDHDPNSVHLSVPLVAHFWRFPFVPVGQKPPTMDCEEDVSCFPEWTNLSDAVAMLLYTAEDGGSGACSGTLIKGGNEDSDIPYFVTAHHCVPDQIRASSIETYWFQRTERCRGMAQSFEALRGGADLLVALADTDTSVLR